MVFVAWKLNYKVAMMKTTMGVKVMAESRGFHSVKKPNQFFPTVPTGVRIKRFYKKVEVVEHPHTSWGITKKLKPGQLVDFSNISVSDKYWAVTLDDRITKTMYKDELLLPSRAIAVALAEEWE